MNELVPSCKPLPPPCFTAEAMQYAYMCRITRCHVCNSKPKNLVGNRVRKKAGYYIANQHIKTVGEK